MSLIRSIVTFCSSCILAASCGELQIGKDTTIIGSSFIGAAWSERDQYTKPAEIDSADFLPSSGSMPINTYSATPFEWGYDVDLRIRPGNSFYFGMTSNYFTFYADQSIEDGGMSLYSQKIRYSQVAWWNVVTAEDVTLFRSPSIGIVLGLDGNRKKETDFLLQYAASVRLYALRLNKFKGYDCVNCPNSSSVKETIIISNGAAIRQSLDIGVDNWRVRGWLEFAGRKQITAGLGIVVWGASE